MSVPDSPNESPRTTSVRYSVLQEDEETLAVAFRLPRREEASMGADFPDPDYPDDPTPNMGTDENHLQTDIASEDNWEDKSESEILRDAGPGMRSDRWKTMLRGLSAANMSNYNGFARKLNCFPHAEMAPPMASEVIQDDELVRREISDKLQDLRLWDSFVFVIPPAPRETSNVDNEGRSHRDAEDVETDTAVESERHHAQPVVEESEIPGVGKLSSLPEGFEPDMAKVLDPLREEISGLLGQLYDHHCQRFTDRAASRTNVDESISITVESPQQQRDVPKCDSNGVPKCDSNGVPKCDSNGVPKCDSNGVHASLNGDDDAPALGENLVSLSDSLMHFLDRLAIYQNLSMRYLLATAGRPERPGMDDVTDHAEPSLVDDVTHEAESLEGEPPESETGSGGAPDTEDEELFNYIIERMNSIGIVDSD